MMRNRVVLETFVVENDCINYPLYKLSTVSIYVMRGAFGRKEKH